MPSDVHLEEELAHLICEGILQETKRRRSLIKLKSNVVVSNIEVLNAHPRDEWVRFQEVDHKYFLVRSSGEEEFPISVSGVWSRNFTPFNATVTIDKYFRRWANTETSKYYALINGFKEQGFCDEDIAGKIQSKWADAGELASAQGTRMHREIELALRGEPFDNNIEELEVFQEFVKSYLEPREWQIWRTEWSVYDEEVMVAGQIDAIFIDTSGRLHMMDWKRVRHELDPNAGEMFQRYGTGLCEHLLDNHFNHYALQQNLYAAILRRKYGLTLTSMNLVRIHPEITGYEVIPVPSWPDLAHELLESCRNLGSQRFSASISDS